MLKKIRHFSHQHDLQLLDGGLEAPCGICNRLIPNDKNRYFCGICGQYRIHEKCAEWLEYMNHSLHPLHPLKLAKRSLNNNSCCYYCEEPFNNDDGHVYGCDDQQCSNVYMHRSCAMIPLLTIASDVDVVCHQKPMILTEHLDSTEDGSDEYYCDVCEEKRDKSFRIYYCEECTYAAHIHCLISEIMKVIKGDNKEVVLRALGEERWDQYLGIMESKSMDLTLKHIMDELTQQEEEMLIHPFGFDDHMSNNRRSRYLYYQQLNSRFNLEGSNEDVDKLVQFFLLNAKSDDDFQNFDNELWYFTPEEEGGLLKLLEDKYLRQEVVDVDGYMVPKRLAPVLKAFLHKYGDLRGEKSLSSAMKSITSTLLCTVFDRMCRTKVEDITRDDLKHLHFYLDGIRKITGFNIGRFLFDYVRSPSRFPLNPFLGFEAIRYETKICENLDNKIATLEAELERCKKNREQLKSETHRSQGSDYMKLCLREASKWKNKYLGDRCKLLDQFGNVDGVCIFCLAENSSTILEEAIQASNGVTRFDNHVPDSISLCDICDNNCHKDRVLKGLCFTKDMGLRVSIVESDALNAVRAMNEDQGLLRNP
ncbi:hypothetical protein L484_018755 [Morus notabilis]|uniref:DC1 domain-containing protein n=1 Tax=Morus notabilis TaxID=981085 RepID=W9RGE6_9ROSA|nr:hypothetical protein L484_018755 [Morus notabilis]